MVAVVLLSGCAGVRQRLLGRGVVRAPVELPEDAEPLGHFLRGQIALTQNDVPTAVKEFEKAIVADPVDARGCGSVSRSSTSAAGELERTQHPSRWSRRGADNLDALGAPGRRAVGARARRRGGRSYERVLAIDPNVQEAYLYLGALYGSAATSTSAVAILKKLIARNPTSILGYYYLGRVHAGSGQLDKAERYYLEALKLSPQSELILTDLAVTYEAQGKSQKAIELYERILAANPESVVVRRRLGAIYVGQKRFDDALDAVPRDRADRRRSARRAHEDRAHLLREGRRSSARRPSSTWCSPPTRRTTASATTSASRTPSSARPSRALDELGARRRQVRLLRRSARAARDAASRRTTSRRAIKEIEATLAREARLARPDELTSASLYREQKRYPKADRRCSRSVVAKYPGQRPLPLHARRRLRRGERSRAARSSEMQRAIELNPKNAAALNYLGYTYADMGVKLDEAEQPHPPRARRSSRTTASTSTASAGCTSSAATTGARSSTSSAPPSSRRPDPTIVEHLGDAYQQDGSTPTRRCSPTATRSARRRTRRRSSA